MAVFFVYAMSRVDCPECGVTVERVPWSQGKEHLTTSYRWFLAGWAKRLLWVAEDCTEQSLRRFFELLADDVRVGSRFVGSDMWRPYLNVITEKIPKALHVLDRFHFMQNMNKAINEVRREEVAKLKRDGYEPVLKHSRWCLLKRPENLTDHKASKLADRMTYNLKSLRAQLLREEFQRFWEYASARWAGNFLGSWCTRVMRSRLALMKKVAKMLRRHRHLILKWFRRQGLISSGTVEWLNGNSKLTTRKARGFRTQEGITIALFHTLGRRTEPEFTRRFF